MSSANGPTLPMSNRRGGSRQHSIYSPAPIEVIDLTDSPPHPRHPLPAPRHQTRFFPPPSTSSRDVIDVDSLPDPPPPPRPSYSLHHPHVRHRPIFLPGEDITRNIDDIITLGDFSDDTPPPPPPPPPQQLQQRNNGDYAFLSILRNQFLGSTSSTSRPHEITHYHYHIHHPPHPPRVPPAPIQSHFVPPGRLNYNLNAAHIYDENTPLRDHPGFKDETYRVPPPARDGFTRSPKENMALICPSCGDELGKSPDDLVKKEVWVAKCGHTYCGSCAATQRRNRAKGVKAGRCIVDGCTRIISGDRGMTEVFL